MPIDHFIWLIVEDIFLRNFEYFYSSNVSKIQVPDMFAYFIYVVLVYFTPVTLVYFTYTIPESHFMKSVLKLLSMMKPNKESIKVFERRRNNIKYKIDRI